MALLLDTPSIVDDPREAVELLLRELRARPNGLSSREAERRLVAYGRNEIVRRGGVRWQRQLPNQFTHPLALLLWLAAALAFVGGAPVLGAAILAVIALNAVFAFAQERQAERAIEALRRFLPPQALVLRDGQRAMVDAGTLVPSDVLLLSEGDRISADGRLIEGTLDVDLSTLTGESQPVYRSAELRDTTGPLIEARDLVFNGSSCVGGEASALVVRTGMQTELGRIAALTERVETELSRLCHPPTHYRCARASAPSTHSRSMRSSRFLRMFSPATQRISGSSLSSKCSKSGLPSSGKATIATLQA